MSILTITNLTHTYDSKLLFEDASLAVNNGEHAGIVGLNGAGKTTFMNILIGNVLQDAGEVKWLNNITFGYLDQHANIDRNQTVMEYLEGSFKELFDKNDRLEAIYKQMETETDMDEMDKLIRQSSSIQDELDQKGFYDLSANIKKVANGLGVNAFGYDTIVKNLSGGQRAKLMLAKLLLNKVDVMLLDEPTNFLDVEHVDWLRKYLESYKGTFLLISHDEDFLNSVCKVIINIENKQIKKYFGDYNQFLKERESNAKQYEENYARQQREIKKMQDYIDRNKARAATAGMANSRKKMLDRIEVMNKPQQILPATFDFPYVLLATKEMLVVKDLEVGYTKAILPPINMQLNGESKIWIRGTNGIGKSTLLKTLMKDIRAISGEFRFNINAKINYLEQDLKFRTMEMNALSYINECYPKMNIKDVRSELAKVGLTKELSTKPISLLSGGEQVRIKLLELSLRPSNIMILDEPTNHLDVLAKESLKEALLKYTGAIILVSHEKDFAGSICNDIFDVEY